MKFPDFIVLGTQKSGTTSLYKYLCQHPQVVPNNYKKEVKFWNYVYDKGLQWYKSCFPDIPGKITGDVTSNYFWDVIPEAMHIDLPKTTKLIVILRNPVDRMYSFYHWLKKYPCEYHPIKDTFEKSIELFIEESNYLAYLRKWINMFGKERVHVIIAEELFKLKPDETWYTLCDYLGIKRIMFDNKIHLKQTYKPMNPLTRLSLNFCIFYQNKALFDYLGKKNIWNQS